MRDCWSPREVGVHKVDQGGKIQRAMIILIESLSSFFGSYFCWVFNFEQPFIVVCYLSGLNRPKNLIRF
jgi:hypothetical protein